MLFNKVSPPPKTAIESIVAPHREKIDSLRKHKNQAPLIEAEGEFVRELFSKTEDSLVVTLDPDELMFFVIDGRWVVNVSRHLPQRQFNLGGFLKLLSPTHYSYTYAVIMHESRDNSCAVRECYTDLVAYISIGEQQTKIEVDRHYILKELALELKLQESGNA